MAEDIVDELEAEGSELSKRAARYIKAKRSWAGLLEEQLRRDAEKRISEPQGDKP